MPQSRQFKFKSAVSHTPTRFVVPALIALFLGALFSMTEFRATTSVTSLKQSLATWQKGAVPWVMHNKPASSDFPGAWLDQIHLDLQPFTNGITEEQLDQACGIKKGLTRVLIYGNKLYIHRSCAEGNIFENGKPHAALFMLLRVLCQYQVPDMELVLNFGDFPVVEGGGKVPLVPIWSWSKTERHKDIQMPYWSFVWIPWQGAKDLHPDHLAPFSQQAWEAKSDTAFWRGSATGGIYTENTWRNQTRAVLVQKCKQRPDLCDAALVHCAQCDPAAKKVIEKELGLSERTPKEESLKHKYVIMVDGNAAPSSRSRYTLQGDSLVLWQQSEYSEFFYASLRPYKHYVPLARGLEDLYSTIEWARSHQQEVKQIVRNVQALTAKYFTADAVDAFLHTLLMEYSKLQSFSPVVNEDYEGREVWLGFHQKNHFLNYMDGRCLYWQNEPSPEPEAQAAAEATRR